MSDTLTPRTDALVRANAGRPHNHGLAPGNPGYEGLDAYKDRKYAEMTTLARQLERESAALRLALVTAPDLPDDFDTLDGAEAFGFAYRAWLAKVRP